MGVNIYINYSFQMFAGYNVKKSNPMNTKAHLKRAE